MVRGFSLLAALLLCAVLAGMSFADDGGVTLDIGAVYNHTQVTHEDAEPFKGWFTVTATNTGTQAWGDFHFFFFDPVGGQNLTNLDFTDASTGGIDPWSTQSPMTWTIAADGSAIDLFFYTDPVGPGQGATFNVYTDNADHLSFFGVGFYATPVPEPMTLGLLSLGGLALLRRKK